MICNFRLLKKNLFNQKIIILSEISLNELKGCVKAAENELLCFHQLKKNHLSNDNLNKENACQTIIRMGVVISLFQGD